MIHSLNRFIDHTLLKPDATVDQIIQLCTEASHHHFAAVCVNPSYVDLAAHLLNGTGVKTATVIGFPLGANLTETKVQEARAAVAHKADELDMVIQIGAAKCGHWDAVTDDIRAVVQAADGRIVKVIIETALLTDDEKRHACEAVLTAQAHFVKTSTGFASGGATVSDIALLRAVIGNTDRCGIKASGGIKTKANALQLIKAGATRLGCSASIAIVSE